ncbi:MAG: polysaccharide biosynthesis/export family protein [Verrucomicrobia bacterium]|nr:polysaccharide biosynthesis/export family protein [Verrucomicrobiota bacterium]MDA0724863.1 polysaccharide biosynthesis/export family protein [Verrucomicrobiota bacterium]MDA1045425.1 polysaccharide biosynthesis/export family protein [Verrucomicrobiota bacterium]
MRVALCLPLCLVLVLAVSLLSARNDDPSILRDPTGYKLRSGDRIKVSVLGEVDCNIEATINNDESVRLAYIGELLLAKMNTKQAETYIAQEYRRQLIFRDPQVSVTISKYVERFVFLSGSVNKQGPYTFPPEAEAMNLVQVIARAGGFNDIANKTKVRVTRTFYDESGKIKNSMTYEVNVEALSSGSAEEGEYKTFMIYPGDQIFVKERLV